MSLERAISNCKDLQITHVEKNSQCHRRTRGADAGRKKRATKSDLSGGARPFRDEYVLDKDWLQRKEESHNEAGLSIKHLRETAGLNKNGPHRFIGNGTIRRCGLAGGSALLRSRFWNLKCSSWVLAWHSFPAACESFTELSVPSPAPCLPVCLHASCHDDKELINPLNCTLTPVNVFLYKRMAFTFNFSTWEAGHVDICEFEASLVYKVSSRTVRNFREILSWNTIDR